METPNIWFSSDWHLGHNKEFCWRPRGYASSEEMTEGIIENFNKLVRPHDICYFLGDMFLSIPHEQGVELIRRFNCNNIRMIIGNHDTHLKLEAVSVLPNVSFLGYSHLMKDGKKWYYLSHYPTLTSNYDDVYATAVRNLFGHTHQKTPESTFSNFALNVGVDAWDNSPVEFGVLKDKMRSILKDNSKSTTEPYTRSELLW